MKLNIKALSLTIGILWALSMFLLGITNFFWPGYGETFLQTMASIYPGYDAKNSIADIFIGTLYGFLDGIVGGFIFGWFYNRLAVNQKSSATVPSQQQEPRRTLNPTPKPRKPLPPVPPS